VPEVRAATPVPAAGGKHHSRGKVTNADGSSPTGHPRPVCGWHLISIGGDERLQGPARPGTGQPGAGRQACDVVCMRGTHPHPLRSTERVLSRFLHGGDGRVRSRGLGDRAHSCLQLQACSWCLQAAAAAAASLRARIFIKPWREQCLVARVGGGAAVESVARRWLFGALLAGTGVRRGCAVWGEMDAPAGGAWRTSAARGCGEKWWCFCKGGMFCLLLRTLGPKLFCIEEKCGPNQKYRSPLPDLSEV
jgi:hypothetical protein